MSKIVLSIGTLTQGGAERVASVLSESFASNFDEVIYLTWINTPDFYKLDHRIQRICVECECGSKSLIRKSIWFRKYVKKEKPDLILSFLEPFNVLVCATMIGIRVPVIVANRNDPRWVWGDLIHRNLRALAYKRANGNLCQTENNMNYFRGSLLQKSHVIYNPVFLPEGYVGKALFTPKKKRIVTVARLHWQKNLTMLIDSFELFHNSHKDYELAIYGNGALKTDLESYIEKKGLSYCIHLPGAQKDVWDNISNAECFVMSSWFEGMPNALLEAMCLGLPCISTKVSGAVDLIKTGENGILIDLDDRKTMARAMSDLIDDKKLADKLAGNATKLYELLREDIICNQWVEYLKSKVAEYREQN